MGKLRSIFQVGRSLVNDFFSDDAMSMAAAVAFYTSLSFAPLVLLLVTLGGLLGDRMQNDLVRVFSEQLGPRAADVTRAVVETSQQDAESRGTAGWQSAFGIVMLFITASGVFGQLQASLNRVWDVEAKPHPGWRGGWAWLRKRLLSMGMVLSLLFILLASLVLSTAVDWLIPDGLVKQEVAGRVVVFVVSFVVSFLLFASMFKLLPDVVIPWHDVWIGAAITALLFNLGKFVLTYYLDRARIGENYGTAAGGLIALLVWVYFSCIVVLVGAEITQAYARWRGSPVRPNVHARWTENAPTPGVPVRPVAG